MQDEKIRDIMISFTEYIIRLKNGIPKVVDALRKENDINPIDIIQCIDGLKWCVDVLISTKDYLAEREIDIDENRLLEVITELLDAFENKDNILIADLLEYEVLEIIDEWRKPIANIL